MELQIGLPFSTHEDPFKGFFDQMENSGVKPQTMEKTNFSGCHMGSDNGCLNNKRSYEEAFGEIKISSSSSCNSLPLLLWSGQPNDEDDRENKKVPTTIKRSNVEEEGDHQVIVGWPPIKSWRRKLLHPNQGGYILVNNRRSGHFYVCQGTRTARDSLIYARQR